MSPKFYSYLWILYFVSAGVIWLAGALTLVGVVVFGFMAFGMVFMGMMCVLPGMSSHPVQKIPKLEKVAKPAKAKPATTVSGFSAYRSA